MKLTDNIRLLPLSGDKGTVYPVLLTGEGGSLLVDCGFPGYWGALDAALAEAGVAALDNLLFTHQDIDHIGCVGEINQRWPAVNILAHEDEAPYLDGRKTPVKLAAMERNRDGLDEDGRAFLDSFRAGFENRRTPIGQTLHDGDILPFGGGVRVIHTPGHTPGHISLYIPSAKLLISGDALNCRDGTLTGPMDRYTQDVDMARRSLQRLLLLDIEQIVCYHGGWCAGGALRSLMDGQKGQLL